VIDLIQSMSFIDLNEDDLEIEIFLDEESRTVTDQIAYLTQAPIRVTHRPTGVSAVGEGQGNQVKNKQRAIELLKEYLAKASEQK
jgi:protein subunit release factor A